MGKQGVNARLIFRPEEHELGFTAFQPHRIIALDFHHSKLCPALRDPITKGEIVTDVENGHRENDNEEYAFHGRLLALDLGAKFSAGDFCLSLIAPSSLSWRCGAVKQGH
jgi:hypothetical protein